MNKQLIRDMLGWGIVLWLIGYILGFVFFFILPPRTHGLGHYAYRGSNHLLGIIKKSEEQRFRVLSYPSRFLDSDRRYP